MTSDNSTSRGFKKYTSPLLDIRKLHTYFFSKSDSLRVVDGINLQINQGETLGLVGESGSGKSTVAFSILRLIPVGREDDEISNKINEASLTYIGARKYIKAGQKESKIARFRNGRIIQGEIIFEGQDLLKLSSEEMQQIRGDKITMIFQDPQAMLHPIYFVGHQAGEIISAHDQKRRDQIRKTVIKHLGQVQIPKPKKRYFFFPHEFSVGGAQRVMIAMALLGDPHLLIADEPTGSLDVLVQRKILDLLQAMKHEFQLSMLLITHNLGIIAEMADKVALMYAGRIIEYCDVKAFFKTPIHPYAKGMIASIPGLVAPRQKLKAIPGRAPNPAEYPKGCRFHPRCEYAIDLCRVKSPALVEATKNHWVECHRFAEMMKAI